VEQRPFFSDSAPFWADYPGIWVLRFHRRWFELGKLLVRASEWCFARYQQTWRLQ
jgi:hypothetical protein